MIKSSFLQKILFECSLQHLQNQEKTILVRTDACLQLVGPKIAICETAFNMIFVLNTSFTTRDNYFRVAIDEACDAFNKMLLEFGNTQKLEIYDPQAHQVIPPQPHLL